MHIAGMRLIHQFFQILIRAELRIDEVIILDIVLMVRTGLKYRSQIDRVKSQTAYISEFFRDAFKIPAGM